MLQALLAGLAVTCAVVKLWLDYEDSRYWSFGDILVAATALFAVVSVAVSMWHIKRLGSPIRQGAEQSEATRLVLDEIWSLKQVAREIKRRWPDCEFVQAPLDRHRWSPLVGRPETGMQGGKLERAIDWHNTFLSYAKNKSDRDYPTKGSFDEVMAAFDRDERIILGLDI